jgi:hypothetical protein
MASGDTLSTTPLYSLNGWYNSQIALFFTRALQTHRIILVARGRGAPVWTGWSGGT